MKHHKFLKFAITIIFLGLPNITLTQNCTEECRLTNARSQKQKEREEAFSKIRESYRPVASTDESTLHQNILDLSFDDLIARLQSRSLKATQVLAAFLEKAINATDEFNCVTEFVPQAMAIARDLDNSPEVKGPLHGLPVCFKENTNIRGMDSTLGYSRLLYRPARKSAVIVKTFQDLGAVPFCKTNVPQTLVSAGSDNPIFGKTLNPLNTELTPGGSTSGTACMVSAGALKIGTATDIGGSARIPAHYTGVSGISLTHGRLSTKGIVSAMPNIVGLKGTAGLIGENPRTIASVLKVLVDNNRQYNYDPLTLPLPWNAHLFESSTSLRIGYFTSLAIFPAMGDTPKTVLAAKEALESRGHTLIDVEDLIDSYGAFDTYSDLLAAEGGKYVKEMLQDDIISPSFRTFNFLLSIPSWKRRFLTRVVPLPDRIRITASAGLEAESSRGLWAKIGEKNAMRDSILKIMEKNSLDLFISPAMPFPAPRNDVAGNLFVGAAYCSLWNLVDFPAGVVPFGVESGKNISDYDVQNDIMLKLAKNNFASSVGMPISVQVIGKPYQDELILRTMIELDSLRTTGTTPNIRHNTQGFDIRNGFPKKSMI